MGGRQLGELPEDLSRQITPITARQQAPGDPRRGASRIVRMTVGIHNGLTVAGSKAAVQANAQRVYLEFQNQSATAEMRLRFGMEASADTGLAIPAGGVHIWDIAVPIDGLYVFCATDKQPFALAEGVEVER
jgi:hypothetical protein